jgi:hypothetical protein
MNINEIDEAHKSDMSDPALIGANDCGLLSRESALIAKVRQLEKDKAGLVDKYNELIMQVTNVIPNETRHETARRIISQHENRVNEPSQAKQHGGEHE